MVPNRDSIILFILQQGNTLQERVDLMLDVEKIKSIISTSQDIILAFFFTQIQFQLYSKILNKISTKTDNVASSSVHLINLLLNHSVWLI